MITIECAFTIRDETGNYYKSLYITLISMFENTQCNINVHIFHDETIIHGKDELTSLCNKYGHSVNFYEVPRLDRHAEKQITQWFNKSSLYRLYIHELLDTEKVIYLDSDTIVNFDISELYKIPIKAHQLVAAVKDYSTYWDKKHYKNSKSKIAYFNFNRDKMFNSGVLLFNLNKCRELSQNGNIFIKTTLQALSDGIALEYPDQDILNSIAQALDDGILWLDESYNYCLFRRGRLYNGLEELQNKIVHYAGLDKPDMILMPAQLLYWKYYAMTSFGGDVFEQMDKVFKTSERMQIFRHYANNSRHRRHASQLLEGGFSNILKNKIKRIFNKK